MNTVYVETKTERGEEVHFAQKFVLGSVSPWCIFN
jgi:hypothetical protein